MNTAVTACGVCGVSLNSDAAALAHLVEAMDVEQAWATVKAKRVRQQCGLCGAFLPKPVPGKPYRCTRCHVEFVVE